MVSIALLAKGVPALFVESDTSNPDVYKAYQAALPSELVDLDRVDGWIQVVNTCDANRDKAVVVNTPARSATGVAKFGSTLGSSLPELGRMLIGLWAINRHRDGIELYAASKAVRPRIESGDGKALNFADLADRVADDLYKDRLTIASAVENLPLGYPAELRRWRAAVGKMLAEIVDG